MTITTPRAGGGWTNVGNIRGPQGVQGEGGWGLRLLGQVTVVPDDVPASPPPQIGDAWFDAEGRLWVWGSEWLDRFGLPGLQGGPGVQGPQGGFGAPGLQGAQGPGLDWPFEQGQFEFAGGNMNDTPPPGLSWSSGSVSPTYSTDGFQMGTHFWGGAAVLVDRPGYYHASAMFWVSIPASSPQIAFRPWVGGGLTSAEQTVYVPAHSGPAVLEAWASASYVDWFGHVDRWGGYDHAATVGIFRPYANQVAHNPFTIRSIFLELLLLRPMPIDDTPYPDDWLRSARDAKAPFEARP